MCPPVLAVPRCGHPSVPGNIQRGPASTPDRRTTGTCAPSSLGAMSTADPRHRTGPQVIPRPPVHRPGGPAPWAQLAPEARASVPLAVLVDAVSSCDRTGDAAATADELSEFSRTFADAFPDAHPAAVLVALFEEAGEARVAPDRALVAPPVPPGRGGLPRVGSSIPGEGIDEGARQRGGSRRSAWTRRRSPWSATSRPCPPSPPTP